MARINLKNFKENSYKNSKEHNLVEGEYSIVHIGNQKLLQIDTFGSDERQIRGKLSQSIQFDLETLKLIVDIYNKKFKK